MMRLKRTIFAATIGTVAFLSNPNSSFASPGYWYNSDCEGWQAEIQGKDFLTWYKAWYTPGMKGSDAFVSEDGQGYVKFEGTWNKNKHQVVLHIRDRNIWDNEVHAHNEKIERPDGCDTTTTTTTIPAETTSTIPETSLTSTTLVETTIPESTTSMSPGSSSSTTDESTTSTISSTDSSVLSTGIQNTTTTVLNSTSETPTPTESSNGTIAPSSSGSVVNTLPKTGEESSTLVMFGMGFLGIGGLALTATKRRK